MPLFKNIFVALLLIIIDLKIYGRFKNRTGTYICSKAWSKYWNHIPTRSYSSAERCSIAISKKLLPLNLLCALLLLSQLILSSTFSRTASHHEVWDRCYLGLGRQLERVRHALSAFEDSCCLVVCFFHEHDGRRPVQVSPHAPATSSGKWAGTATLFVTIEARWCWERCCWGLLKTERVGGASVVVLIGAHYM